MSVISIVDDDPSIGRALRRVLQSFGYVAEAFTSAYDFLASAPLGRTACLVLDIHLAGMTGFELQQRLVARGSTIPIIFITAHDDVATRARVQQVGAAAYLPKPFGADALLAVVERAAGPA